MRGQVSVEYLVIVGIALGLLIPTVMFFYSYNQASRISSISAQVSDIGIEMVTRARSTYALGKNARQTVEVNMPEEVTRVYVAGPSSTELIFVYETAAGPGEAVFFSATPIVTTYADGNISLVHPGITRYQFESLGNSVNVTEVIG